MDDEVVPTKAPPIPFDGIPTPPGLEHMPPPIKEPPLPKPMPRPSFADLLDDGRNLHGPEAKARRAGNTATNQVAKFGRAASASGITGLAASAAENLGASGQQLNHLTTFGDTQGFTTNQVLLAFILGIMVGMFILRYLQSSSLLTPLYRLSGYLR